MTRFVRLGLVVLACVLSIPALTFAQGPFGGSNDLTIFDASVNASNNQVTIQGEDFRGARGRRQVTVTLGNAPLAIVGAPTSTQIVAQLPAGLAAGTYLLTVEDVPGNQSDTFNLAIGAIGPTGPQGQVGPMGPAGPMGIPGPIGATGATGAPGPQGAPGATGPAGPIGPAGSMGVPGPIGPTGATGAVGATGPTGAAGPQGPAGSAGPAGPQGSTGAQGPQGNQGPTGAQGPQGIALPFSGTTTVSNDAAFSVTNSVFPYGIGIKGVASSGTGGYFYGGNSNVTGFSGVEAHGGGWGSSGGIAGSGALLYGGVGAVAGGAGNGGGHGLVSYGGDGNNGAGVGAIIFGGNLRCGNLCGPYTDHLNNYGISMVGDGMWVIGGPWGSGIIAAAGANGGYGILAYPGGPGSYAGYFAGDVHVAGTLSKAAGSFKIDDPIDPENKFLSHSFVESPDMMNIYNGMITLDSKGEAWVTMPEYFEALNQDFRYQLTCVGGFAQVYIAKKVEGNRFQIAGGAPGLEVSWQVTGVRHDAYAQAHRIPVEEMKPEGERGLYLNPEAFGKTEEQAIHKAPPLANTNRQQ